MPSAAMNRLMDDARPRLPGALDNAIQAELFNATVDLLNKSGCWKEILPVPVKASTLTYLEDQSKYRFQIMPPAGSRVERLLGVANERGAAVKGYMPETNILELPFLPTEDVTYQVWVVLTVTDPVTRQGYPVVPDWIVDKYSDVLLNGIWGRMMSQPAKPYTSVQLASYHSRAFTSGVSKARIDADRANVQGGQAWRFPQTFAARGRNRG